MGNNKRIVYDRLYLQMQFPSLISELLDCPGLLRLRDVRMANNQFYAFPAFANTSRYEHSLGVCYLAGITADHLHLNEKDKLELMIAGLYHDVCTPPFAHAMEEVLQAKYGFNHEENLKQIITGNTGEFDQDFAQIYLGKALKLKSIWQRKDARTIGIDLHRIAKIAVGSKDEILSSLINGHFMDLDNIDNICRAVSAMGIYDKNCDFADLAISLAKSFVKCDGKILYNAEHYDTIKKWVQMRDYQYSKIYSSLDDFSYQAMIKRSIRYLCENRVCSANFEKELWKKTDTELTQILLENEKSRNLMERVLLCKPYHCLALLYVRGKDVNQFLNRHIREMEKKVCYYLSKEMGIIRYADDNLVLANYYPDKRHRFIDSSEWSDSCPESKIKTREEGSILGLFTSSKVSGFTLDKIHSNRTLRRFDKNNLPDLMNQIREILKDYEVIEYGKEN